MFLGDLAPSEKRLFLALAKKMIAADGVRTPEETAMIHDIAVEMDLDGEETELADSIEDVCAQVGSRRSRAFFLLELASIAYVDSHYAEEERAIVRAIAELWDVDPITVVRVECWAEKRLELSQEAAEVLRELGAALTES